MIEEADFRVYEVAFPGDIQGAVRIDENGFASVYINSALGPAEKREVLNHEIRHLERGDHMSHATIYEVEAD